MAGWGLQGTCQHILPHGPYVLCHNCQKRFGVARMVCGCGLARRTRRQECVSFNCTDMPRIKGKNTGRLSSLVPVTLSWKEMFVYNKRANLWITKPNWQLQGMCKNQFESLLPSTMYSSCNCRQSHLVLTSSPHSTWQAWFWREAGRSIWDLLVPARNCQMLTGGCLTVRAGAWLPQFFGLFCFFACMYLAQYTPQFGNLDPY